MSSDFKPFEGLKVLELSSVLAGPLAGSFFAEGGAEVTKVEHPQWGDVTRSWRAKGEAVDGEISAYYASANTYKNVQRVDLKTMEGLKWLEEALESTDVLLQNFKDGDLEEFNLMPEKVARRFPKLVHIRLVGFADAPTRLAYDVVVQAETGFMHMNGSPDGQPTRMPVALMDVLASDQIRAAALSGLYSRERGEKGWYSEVSLERSGLAALVNRATNYLMNGDEQNRTGSEHPNIAPYGDVITLRTGRQVVLAVGNDKQFEGLCEVLGLECLAEDDRFSENVMRVRNRAQLMKELRKVSERFEDVDALMEDLMKKGVPAGLVRPLSEVFALGATGRDHLIDEGEIDGRRVIKPRVVAYFSTVFGK
jgi:crotonobetainyl-CoA:carnitine CoA-transferase CaiB-like acyl-CoA transferase